MATSLIVQLNKLVAKTPDEIVVQLKGGGWVNIARMTAEQADALDGQEVVVGADNGPPSEPFWVVSGGEGGWVFNADGWYPYDGESSYFWFILFEDYRNGVFPPEYAQQARDQDP